MKKQTKLKSEFRISNFETKPKSEFQTFKRFCFEFYILVIRICFGFPFSRGQVYPCESRGASYFGFYAAALAGCLLTLAAGCENAGPSTSGLASQIERLSQEKIRLQNQLEQCKTENERLKARIETLAALPKGHLELWALQRIEIGRFTALYDEDKDGKKEKLIVYVQPIDQDGDTVKAPGAINVQLWDLNKKDDQALLGEWPVGPDQLKKLWLTALLASNYKLTFDVADKAELFKEPLTVKVAFTDYLTGKTFKEQKVIKP